MFSNVVIKVQNKRVLVTLINPTKEAIKLKTRNWKELVHEEFKDLSIRFRSRIYKKNLKQTIEDSDDWKKNL